MRKLITLALLISSLLCLALSVEATVGTVIYGYKTDEKPNMEKIDETWGEPSIYITKDTPNAELHKYWSEKMDTGNFTHPGTGPNGRQAIEPEPSDFWLYATYDDKNIYIGIKSPDSEINGWGETHRGDGARIWLQPLALMKNPYSDYGLPSHLTEYDDEYLEMESYYNFYWNLAYDDESIDTLYAAQNVYEVDINFYDGYMHATIAIPKINMGLQKNDDPHGIEFGICAMRISSRGDSDEGYAGWLTWGATLRDYTPTPTSVNTLILINPELLPPDTDAPETDVPETDAPETDAPETDAPETDAPETDAPETDAPETVAPETDAPETDAPETDAPETDAPETDAPETDAPETDAPETDAPETDAPETDAPETDAPETEAPETDAPETDAPETDAPETEAPETEAPAEPAKKNNTGLIIGIVAAVIAVGAIAGVVITKKKK